MLESMMKTLIGWLLVIAHWGSSLMLWMSSLFVPSPYIRWALYFQLAVMISWILTQRCILWDIQKWIDPTFRVDKDATSDRLGFEDRSTWLMVTHTVIYMNTLALGYRSGMLPNVVLFLIVYMILNGQYLHKGDDTLTKYT